MTRHRSSLIALLGAGVLAVGAFTGCSSGVAAPASSPSADATDTAAPAEVGAGWIDGGRGIAVVTYGSSSCPPVVAGAPSLSGSTLAVELADRSVGPCTRDMAPRATYVGVPTGIDPSAPLEIEVGGVVTGTARLAGLSGAPTPVDFAPSAGWVGSDLVAILTWGSSGCRPQVEAVTSTEGGATVTFVDPPADQVCTMDLAPRVTLADLTGVAGDGPLELTLAGGNVASDGPIPVIGQR